MEEYSTGKKKSNWNVIIPYVSRFPKLFWRYLLQTIYLFNKNHYTISFISLRNFLFIFVKNAVAHKSLFKYQKGMHIKYIFFIYYNLK